MKSFIAGLSRNPLTATVLFLCCLSLSVPASAEAVYDENAGVLSVSCVFIEVNGETAMKNGKPKAHAVEITFSDDLRTAMLTAANKIEPPEDCTGVVELTTLTYSDQFEYDGETLDIQLAFTGGVSFNTVQFLPGLDLGPMDLNSPYALYRVSDGSNAFFLGGVVKAGAEEFSGLALGTNFIDFVRPNELLPSNPIFSIIQQADIVVTEASREDINNKLLDLYGLYFNSPILLTFALEPDILSALEDYLSPLGLEAKDIAGIRPHWAAELIGMLEVLVQGYVLGPERTILNVASVNEKEMLGLEPADTFIRARNMNKQGVDPNAEISGALDSIDDGSFLKAYNALLDAWIAGDLDYVESVLVDPIRNDSLEKFAREFTDRYAFWMPQLEAMLETEETEFVLVNIKHLAGPDSLLNELEEAGLTVEGYTGE